MISAERSVAAPPERVFEFLSDLRNHWRLERGTFLALDEVSQTGGVIRLRGPLGLSRTVRTQVLEARRPSRLSGRADLTGGTVGLVAWTIEPDGGGSLVRLTADVADAWLPDRVFLALGGYAWFRRLFERALTNLDRAL